MIVWFFIYICLLAGLCYLAIERFGDSIFASGIILFIFIVLELWTIGRIIVNPVNRIWAVAMLAANTVASIVIIIFIFRNKG